jgi:hypothetical protein
VIKVEFEHPTQAIASAFLRAIADDDTRAVWERLSRETRGLLEGLRAARSGLALQQAAAADDATLAAVVAPLRDAALATLGGQAHVLAFGVSSARIVDRQTVYVLLIPDVEKEGLLAEGDWRPSHLIAFVHESREWLVDLGRTSALSAEAGLPDPLGIVR